MQRSIKRKRLACISLISLVSAFQSPNDNCRSTSSRRINSSNTVFSATSLIGGSNTIDTSENAYRDIGTFEEWTAACGVQKADGFQLFTNEDGHGDVQAITTQDLQGGQPALFVPNHLILRGSTCRQELGPLSSAEELFRRLKVTHNLPQFYLFLKILTEFEFGDQSPWFPWLNSLPRYFSTGASMTHFCCTECLPPFVGSLANQERIRFIQYFRALQFVGFFQSRDTNRNRKLAKWAFAVVSTRSFTSPDGDSIIVPMADMFNHGTDTEIEINYDEQGNCYAYTTYDIPAGSPLRMSYGDPSNPSFLFARYGFLDETSPATFCKIMVATPTQQLIDMGYDQSRMLFYKDTGDVSEEVWDVLLYQLLESNPAEQQALYHAHMNGDYETKQAIHGQYYPQTFSALMNHIDTFLNRLDQLAAKAEGRDLRIHPRLPLIRKHNDFVRNTFLTVRSRLLQQQM